jgi:hypothetical protein
MTNAVLAYLCFNAAALLLSTRYQRRYLLYWTIRKLRGR